MKMTGSQPKMSVPKTKSTKPQNVKVISGASADKGSKSKTPMKKKMVSAKDSWGGC